MRMQSLIGGAQSITGRLALWTVAILLLTWHGVSLFMLGAFSLVMVFPARRHILLSIAAVGTISEKLLEATGLDWLHQPLQISVMLLAGVGGLYLAYALVKQFQHWPAFARRSPILLLHACIWSALFLSTYPMLGALTMLPFLAWRLSYMVKLAGRGKAADTRFSDHLFYLVPVYGGTQTPYAKGLDFLARHEAADPATFARSQLAGIKLLWLALLWVFVLDVFDASLFGSATKFFTAWPAHWTLDLPRLAEHLQTGTSPAWYLGWATVYLELIRATLHLAISGHVIIGCLRLLGFNVFRNTYKPLLAESVLEFWNRYYYYFKELLVDFFFYPAYLRFTSLSPRTRMFAAVFSAAFLGNMYHHIMAQPDTVIHLDLAGFWAAWGPRSVYCFLLAAGIWVSMLRQQKSRVSGVKPGWHLKLRRIAGVWTFFGIIQIWNIGPKEAGILDCLAFFVSLFGI